MAKSGFDVEVMLHTNEGLKTLRKFVSRSIVFSTRDLRIKRKQDYRISGVSVIGHANPSIHVYVTRKDRIA